VTALNLFVQGKAAYLLSDSAMLDADRNVVSLKPKILSLAPIRAAVGFTGCYSGDHDKDLWLDVHSIADAIAQLPRILSAIRERNIEGGIRPERAHVTAFVAVYDDGPRGYICTTGGKDLSGLPPLMVAQVGRAITPQVDLVQVFGRALDPESEAFDAVKHGKRLIEAQRLQREPEGHYSVGGSAELAKVSAKGVEGRTTAHWRDRIGRPINPTA
jgi:hypothetical protein